MRLDRLEVRDARVAAVSQQQAPRERRGIRQERAFRLPVRRDLHGADLVGTPAIGGVDLHGGGAERREPPRKRPSQGRFHRKRRPVVDHDVGEARHRRVARRGEGLQAQPLDQPGTHPAHEQREPDPGEPIVKGFVRHVDAVVIIEGAQQVRERRHVATGQRRHHREEQPMRRDRPQPDGLPRVTPELIDGLDRERPCQDVPDLGKLCRGHRSLPCWLVSQPQHEGC